MDVEISAKVTVIGFGLVDSEWLSGIDRERQVISINDSFAHYGYEPDLIIALDDLSRDEKSHPEYVKNIVNAGVPVLVCTAYDKWPSTVTYPIDTIVDWLEAWVQQDKPRVFQSRILSNTWNYTLAYLAYAGAKDIEVAGADWVNLDKEWDLELAKMKLRGNDPDWVKYHQKMLVRKPVEPGDMGFYWLCGLLMGMGIIVRYGTRGLETTLFDSDRPAFFYGYQEQPYELV